MMESYVDHGPKPQYVMHGMARHLFFNWKPNTSKWKVTIVIIGLETAKLFKIILVTLSSVTICMESGNNFCQRIMIQGIIRIINVHLDSIAFYPRLVLRIHNRRRLNRPMVIHILEFIWQLALVAWSFQQPNKYTYAFHHFRKKIIFIDFPLTILGPESI